MDAARYQPPAYVPQIRDLPDENRVQPIVLAPRGEAFYPSRQLTIENPPDASKLKLTPEIYPLSANAKAVLPTGELPSFDGLVNDKLSSPSWRFLLSLNPGGGVTECVALAKGGEPAAAALEAWLHRLQFKPEPGNPARWISIGVGFTNQPADGSDAR